MRSRTLLVLLFVGVAAHGCVGDEGRARLRAHPTPDVPDLGEGNDGVGDLVEETVVVEETAVVEVEDTTVVEDTAVVEVEDTTVVEDTAVVEVEDTVAEDTTVVEVEDTAVVEDTTVAETIEPPDTSILADAADPADTGSATSDAHVAVPDLAALRVQLDAYFDLRFAPPAAAAADTDDMVAAIERSGATLDQIDALIRGGRAAYPDVSATIDQITERAVVCDHVDYTSSYFLYVPPSYDASVATPVVIATYPAGDGQSLDEARAAAFDTVDVYREALATMGAIVASPATTRGWSPLADSMVFTIISQLQRQYHIDPDRIFVMGRGAGGHMAWRSTFLFADRYAAFAPVGGGYAEYLSDNRMRNLFGTHGFQTWSSANSAGLRQINADLADFLDEAGYDWTAFEYQSAALALPTEMIATITKFFAVQRRDMWPAALYFWSGGSMRYDHNWAGQTETIYLDRTYRWNDRYWLTVSPASDATAFLDVYARVIDDHTIDIQSSNVRQVRVHLDPKMGIDFGKRLQIFANNELRFDGPIAPALGPMLETVREFDDRGRVYRAFVDVSIPTDTVVDLPTGEP